MAKRRKRRHARRSHRRGALLGNRKHRGSRRHSRRFLRNSPGSMMDGLVLGLAGLAALAASRKVGEFAASKMPLSVPQGPLVAEAGAALAVGLLAAYLPASKNVKDGVVAGAVIALGMALLPHGIQQSIGLENVALLPPPPPPSGSTPAGVSAALDAALDAEYEQSNY